MGIDCIMITVSTKANFITNEIITRAIHIMSTFFKILHFLIRSDNCNNETFPIVLWSWLFSWNSVNEQTLINLVNNRDTGLITVGNHQTFIDDFFIWHDLGHLFHLKWSKHRWVLGSADVCFHKFLDQPLKQKLVEWFFTAGKTIPVTHGDGVYQPGIDFAIER